MSYNPFSLAETSKMPDVTRGESAYRVFIRTSNDGHRSDHGPYYAVSDKGIAGYEAISSNVLADSDVIDYVITPIETKEYDKVRRQLASLVLYEIALESLDISRTI